MFANKYDPKEFADLVFQNDIARKTLERYANGTSKGSILLHGPYGSSKSTTAKIIARQAAERSTSILEFPVEVLNCADYSDKKLKKIQNGLRFSQRSYTYVVFDEFDTLTSKDQHKVRSFLDDNEKLCGLILTTNNLHLIEGAIKSRCEVVELPACDANTLLPKCQKILVSEGITLTDQHVLDAIDPANGDWRNILRQLEYIVGEARRKHVA